MAYVLVADDDPIICTLLEAALTTAGHRVTVVGDGRAAQSAVAREKPDVLLIDILMPEQDGLETIVNVRRAGHGMKIIAISGGGSGTFGCDRLLSMARGLGADATMAKPIEFDTLSHTLDSMLRPPPPLAAC